MPETPDHNKTTLRPAAVLVIDLVEHSVRPMQEAHRIQHALETVFVNTLKSLSITDVAHNYTGDGYVCAFLGDASTRIIDFLNSAIPELKRQLEVHQQSFRAGLDYGFLHLRANSLTKDLEHFDRPGIVAARLQSAAEPGQVLCSATVYEMFGEIRNEAFEHREFRVETKDRSLSAFSMVPFDFAELEELLTDYVYADPGDKLSTHPEETPGILIADDNQANRELLEAYTTVALAELDQRVPIEFAIDGQEALEKLQSGKYALVLLDIMMPKLSGYEVAKRIPEIDPNIVIVAVTALRDLADVEKFFSVAKLGYFLSKPINARELYVLIAHILKGNSQQLIQLLSGICNNPGIFLNELKDISHRFRKIVDRAEKQNELIHSLIQHKAKNTFFEFLNAIRPGNDLTSILCRFDRQIGSLSRLIRGSSTDMSVPLWSSIRSYVDDTRELNPHLKISYDPNQECDEPIDHRSILYFAVCELIDNAVDAASENGEIAVKYSLLKSKAQYQLVVQDSGRGVPPEIEEQMFESGVSSRGDGRGMGLNLVRSVVNRVGGTISYQNRNGACFTVLIPADH